MARSKPYSSVAVKDVDVLALARAHAGQACVLGVDVGKFELVAALRWADGSFQRPWRVGNPGEVRPLVAKLGELRASCPALVVAMESSGTYGDGEIEGGREIFSPGACLARVSVYRLFAIHG